MPRSIPGDSGGPVWQLDRNGNASVIGIWLGEHTEPNGPRYGRFTGITDVLADITRHADCWGHYHTGGLPGRNEIDNTQTLDYARIMRAIVATGYTGYVGQEFIPKRDDALKSLAEAVAICDV